MHCVPSAFSNHQVESPRKMTKEDKTDPESEASVEDRDDASAGLEEANDSMKKPRRRRRRRRRRKSAQDRMMIGPVPVPIAILQRPKIGPLYPPVSGSILVESPPFYTPPPPRTHWTTAPNPMVIGRHLALDCEMVGVGPFGRRSVLARVSIVNWNGHVVLDTFVKVTEPVTDYRTFVSGIRPSDLESPRAMDFGDCRLLVNQLLQGKILIGHGLDNDLKVLRLSHPWSRTRDTATYEPFMHSGGCQGKLRARKLKELAETQLGAVIQGKEHDSVEDARCVMELYKRVQHSWEFSVEWQQRAEPSMSGY